MEDTHQKKKKNKKPEQDDYIQSPFIVDYPHKLNYNSQKVQFR